MRSTHRLRVAVEIEHEGCLGVPRRHDGIAPPVAALIVVHVPGHRPGCRGRRCSSPACRSPRGGRRGRAGRGRTRCETPWRPGPRSIASERRRAPNLSQIAMMLCFSWVAKAHVVHARSVAAGHGGVVHRGLAAHPRGIDGAGSSSWMSSVTRKPSVFHVRHGARHIGGHLVEVIEAHQFAPGCVQVVAPRQSRSTWATSGRRTRRGSPADLRRAPSHRCRWCSPRCRRSYAASEFLVEGDRSVEVFRGCARDRRTPRRRRPGL